MSNDKVCGVQGCGGRRHAAGLCTKHYRRLKRTGDPNGTKPSFGSTPNSLRMGNRTLVVKSCTRCDRLLGPEHFYRAAWGWIGDCKDCRSTAKKAARQKPYGPGLRALVAKTCTDCGELRAGDRFLKSADQWSRKCLDCLVPHLRAAVAAAQTETRRHASRHGQEWTGAELEVAQRPDLSTRTVAVMLGRTFYAVETQRKLLTAGHTKVKP